MSRGVAGMLNDPLVPLDLGGWFKRVFGVMARNHRTSLGLVAVPAGVYLVGLIAIIAAMPTEASLDRRIASATRVAEAAGEEVDRAGVMWSTFGPLLAVILIFTVVFFLVVAMYLAGSFHLAARAADGQPSTVIQAVQFARPRMLPLIGWYALTNLVVVCTCLVVMLPGLLAGDGRLVAIGVICWLPVAFVVMVVFGAVLLGVVVVERGGPSRAFALLRPRFWPTLGRLMLASLLYMVWGGLMNTAMVPFNSALEAATVGVSLVVGAVVQSVLLVPALMFVAAVGVVTYAELRHREDRSVGTGALAAQLAR